jgi:cytochrome P450
MVPGAKALFGHIHLLGECFLEALHTVCVKWADESGLCSFWLTTTPIVTILHAKHVKQAMLASNFRAPIPLLNDHFDHFLGPKALVLVMNDEWKHERLATSRAFHFENLKPMVAEMSQVAALLAAKLKERAQAVATGLEVELLSTMKMVTEPILFDKY